MTFPRSSSRQREEPKKHEGMCCGGPIDGRVIVSAANRLVVPIEVKGEPGFCQYIYVWHPIVQMWVPA